MSTVFVTLDQLVLVRENGVPTRLLGPGRHSVWSLFDRVTMLRIHLSAPSERVLAFSPETAALLGPDEAHDVTVAADEVAIVTVDGRATACLEPGRHLVLRHRADVAVERVSLASLFVTAPRRLTAIIPDELTLDVMVSAHERALVFADGVLARVLEPGSFTLSKLDRTVTVRRVDVRERTLTVAGQEIMTADKATLRVTLVVRFAITDPERAELAVDDLEGTLRTEAQLVVRAAVGALTVDGLLERRGALRAEMEAVLRATALAWGVEVKAVEVRDVVLPGELRTLMNQVIEAEKAAIAEGIRRREETAATRSLLNTARLMEGNPVLLRLKELEAMKEIAGRIDKITVHVGAADLAKQLSFATAK